MSNNEVLKGGARNVVRQVIDWGCPPQWYPPGQDQNPAAYPPEISHEHFVFMFQQLYLEKILPDVTQQTRDFREWILPFDTRSSSGYLSTDALEHILTPVWSSSVNASMQAFLEKKNMYESARALFGEGFIHDKVMEIVAAMRFSLGTIAGLYNFAIQNSTEDPGVILASSSRLVHRLSMQNTETTGSTQSVMAGTHEYYVNGSRVHILKPEFFRFTSPTEVGFIMNSRSDVLRYALYSMSHPGFVAGLAAQGIPKLYLREVQKKNAKIPVALAEPSRKTFGCPAAFVRKRDQQLHALAGQLNYPLPANPTAIDITMMQVALIGKRV